MTAGPFSVSCGLAWARVADGATADGYARRRRASRPTPPRASRPRDAGSGTRAIDTLSTSTVMSPGPDVLVNDSVRLAALATKVSDSAVNCVFTGVVTF